MTIPRRLTNTIVAIQHLAIAARHRLDTTIPRLIIELDGYDGYPTTASGSDSGGHSPFIPAGPNASTSSTERAALTPDERNDTDTRAIGPRASMEEMQGLLDAAVLALETVIVECDKLTPGLTTIDISRLRCATIPKGACTDWRDDNRTDGLCITHGRATDANRRRAHRHKNGAT